MELKSGYKQTDVGVIPEEWKVLSFADVFNVSAGGDVDPKRSAPEPDETHCYPIYSNALTNRGLYGYCSYADHQAGSITITARGTLGVAQYRDHAFTAIGRVLVLHPKRTIDGRYFAEVINNRVKFAIESTGVPQLTAPQISTYWLPFPHVTEQRAIAAALGDVDVLIGAQEDLIAKKRDLRQAVKQSLLMGRTRLPGFSGAWESKRLGEMGYFSKGRGLAKEELSSSGTLPAIPYTAIYTDHDEVIQTQQIRYFAKSAAGLEVVNSPHVLIASSSNMLENVGKASAYVGGADVAVGGDILLYKTAMDVRFLSYLLSTYTHRKRIVFLSQGSTIRHVYVSTLRTYEVTTPSTPEQTAIADVLSDMDAEIAALEMRLAKTHDLKQGMMQELLTGRTRLVGRGAA